jgi:transcriptional regulator with XRE-family HTH domain
MGRCSHWAILYRVLHTLSRLPTWGAMPQLFGDKLRHVRRQQHMTQAAFAHQLSLAAYTHVAKLEGGQRVPSLDLVIRMAHLLNVSTDYFLRDTIPIEEIKGLHVGASSEVGVPVSFGVKLKTLRLQHQINQTQAAAQLVISRAYLSNLEAGRKMPSLDLAVQIADLFGVPTDYLLLSALPPHAHSDASR